MISDAAVANPGLASAGVKWTVVNYFLKEFRHWSQSPFGQKAIRYTLGSGIAFGISQAVFLTSFAILHLFGSRNSSILATLAGAVPSYFMNRHWAWQKRSRSHLSKEVIPYFVMAIVSLVFSTWSADFASSHRSWVGSSHLVQVGSVDAAYIASFVILWFAKYKFMDKVLFASSHQPISQAGAREAGVSG